MSFGTVISGKSTIDEDVKCGASNIAVGQCLLENEMRRVGPRDKRLTARQHFVETNHHRMVVIIGRDFHGKRLGVSGSHEGGISEPCGPRIPE